MIDYVELDNLPPTANHLLNILWDKNCELTLNELTELTNTLYSTHWSTKDIKPFLRLLLQKDYIQVRRQRLTAYYSALGYGMDM